MVIIIAIVVLFVLKNKREEYLLMRKETFNDRKPLIIGETINNTFKEKFYYINTSNDKANNIYNEAIEKLFNQHTLNIKWANYYNEKLDLTTNISHRYDDKKDLSHIVYSSEYETVYNDISNNLDNFGVLNIVYSDYKKPYDLPLLDNNCKYSDVELYTDDEKNTVIKLVDNNRNIKVTINSENMLFSKIIKEDPVINKIETTEFNYTNEIVKLPQEIVEYAQERIEKYKL